MYRSAWTRLNATPGRFAKFMEVVQQEHVIELEEYASGLSLSESKL